MSRTLDATSQELLVALRGAYKLLARIGHQWPGRDTPDGQELLCSMRDAIANAEARQPQYVQDENSWSTT